MKTIKTGRKTMLSLCHIVSMSYICVVNVDDQGLDEALISLRS
jgi:hypothetical protein